MNERIRELIRESNLDMYGLGKERHRWEYTVKKFAESIVKECATRSAELGQTELGKGLIKHFGVEE